MAKQSYPYYMPSPRMTRTTPGSYEAPVEGIVDLTAFEKGFQSGIAPGIKAVEEDAKLGVEAGKDFDKINTSVKVFSGENKNVMTGGQDLITNDLFEVDAKINTTSLRKKYIKAYKRNDTDTMDSIVNQIGGKQKAYAGLALYTTNIGDNEKNDGAVSNTKFIDENKNKVEFNGADFTDLNNNRPKDIRQGSKVSKDGILKQGFYVKKDDEEVFLNTEDIDEAYINRNFNLRYNIQDEVNKTIEKDGITTNFNRTPKYRTETTGGTTITLSDGSEVNVLAKDVKKYVDSDWFKGAEANSEIAAQKIIANEYARESLWNQFTTELKNGTFKSNLGNLAGLESIKNIDLTDPKVASEIDDRVLTEGLRDYAKQKWLITVGNQGYVKGEDGRALQLNDFLYSKTRTKTTKPVSDKGDFTINFGGKDLDNDLLKRTRELLAITSIQTSDQGQINQASRDNVVAYIQGQELNFETTEKGTQKFVSGKIDGVTSDMVTLTSRKITTGPDKGQTKAVISIQPKPQQLVQNGPIVEFEPIKYDLTQESDIEKLLANQYGFSTDKGKKFKAQYDPVLDYLRALRRGTIKEDGTPVAVPNELNPN
tara:strand:- start:484 stop:2268 length:1785 start_codon:yes stop_codon:yes gene_type:complete